MKRTSLDRGWRFRYAGAIMGVANRADSAEQTVDLPHDFTIHTDPTPDAPGVRTTGYYQNGAGHYEKIFTVPLEEKGSRILAEFDGAFMNANVLINGNLVRTHHYGYTPFHADLTKYIRFGGENRLEVTISNSAEPNTRWYSGSGLYRHVALLTAPKKHLVPWGLFARTERIDPDGTAFVRVDAEVVNETDEDALMHIDLSLEACASSGHSAVFVPAGETTTAHIQLTIPDARIWDIENPALYTLHARLTEDTAALDTDEVHFGIRTISVDPENGFRLNGRTVKLKGGCIHHENGILGAASFYDAEYRRLKKHKDAGYNAIRCAHNPPSRDMLDCCDRLGLLVLDEAFDCWTLGKNTYDFGLYFQNDWKAELTAMVRRDRNHPSVILWSTGNEIFERSGLHDGYRWARDLAECVRTLDPTRFITNGINGFMNNVTPEEIEALHVAAEEARLINPDLKGNDSPLFDTLTEKYLGAFVAPLDVIGYNYSEYRYAPDHRIFPNKVFCGTESFPNRIDEYWEKVESLPYVIGDFTWTSWDYIGEAHIGDVRYDNDMDENISFWSIPCLYPWRLANCGDFDICGNPMPQLAYRRIVWGSTETYIVSRRPEHFGVKEIISKWGWPEVEHAWYWPGQEGKPVGVDVYSRGDEVELFADGVSLGRQPAGKANRFIAKFTLPYHPGRLEAVSYREGKALSRDAVESCGEAADFAVTLEKPVLAADGQSLCYAMIEITDAQGRRVPNAALAAQAEVCGAAVLQGFGSGNPCTGENYTTGRFTTYKGRVTAIVRAGFDAGEAVLRVTIDGLGTREARITVQ